ncbi:hypothetical protein [Terrabacter sp. NPDC080008]|uniref:hypothetical protein n=1 Tax=Terrabacter sp. NPDC080008 TaxID=3155176 RepID=UPI00344BB205
MTSTMTGPPDHDLERALRDLADGAGLPATPLAEDLRRGRRSLRRHRATTGVGSAAGAAVLVGAALLGTQALHFGPSAPAAPASSGSTAPNAATATPTSSMTTLPDSATATAKAAAPAGPPAIAAAVARHLDPQERHYPGKEKHYEHSSGFDRLGTTSAGTTVPWVAADHRATTGVTVRIMRDTGPQCAATPGESWGVPSCRSVRLGGVAVTKVTFADPGARAPEYWRQNTKGAWVAVDVFRVDDAFLTDPNGSSAVDVDPLPELGIDEQEIGPLLADPALDVTVLDG